MLVFYSHKAKYEYTVFKGIVKMVIITLVDSNPYDFFIFIQISSIHVKRLEQILGTRASRTIHLYIISAMHTLF